ncbi:hypothetical protein [Variovorax atrisoli]|uniref:hypothetical protein n=1 Tax=Variovorax atrisoli TaxID=3394203 RepID=UPI00160A8463|nr:hypothetical protein [Variovorax sp. BK613]MBB3637162.1 hypothetical protein [Variovorax sp. BK613]
MTTKELITQAEHARRCSVSRKSVTIWKERGQLVLVGNLIDFEASYKGERWHASAKKVFADDAAQDVARAPAKPPAAARSRRADPGAPVTLSRGEVVRRLRALDWTQDFDWSQGAQRARALAAAEAVGLQAVESPAEDDGHWGGFQLRNVALMERRGGLCFDAIAAGYGFELEDGDVLFESRQRLDHPDDGLVDMDEPVTIRLDQLPLLAYPFGPTHQKPAS